MIVYSNHFWGLPLLLRMYGSAFPRAILFAASSAIGTAMLYYFGANPLLNTLKNPFVYQIFGFVVGFALVFRSSLSYNRYWEARTSVQIIMGRLTLFSIQTINLDLWSRDVENLSTEEKEDAYMFYNDLVHYVSLLFALMLRQLRKEYSLDEFRVHKVDNKPPALDAQDVVSARVKYEAFFTRMFSIDDIFEIDTKFQDSFMYVIGGLPEEEKALLRDPVPLRELSGKSSVMQGARVFCVFGWLSKLLVRRVSCGGLKNIPPQFARISGSLEEAMSAFGQAAKLASTQFPFPWAQVVMAFLFMMAATLPFVVVAFVEQIWIGIMMCFITVMTYWSLNEVASEMEDPFGYDPNDLPLSRFIFDFNQNVLASTWQLRPAFFDELEKTHCNESAALELGLDLGSKQSNLNPLREPAGIKAMAGSVIPPLEGNLAGRLLYTNEGLLPSNLFVERSFGLPTSRVGRSKGSVVPL